MWATQSPCKYEPTGNTSERITHLRHIHQVCYFNPIRAPLQHSVRQDSCLCEDLLQLQLHRDVGKKKRSVSLFRKVATLKGYKSGISFVKNMYWRGQILNKSHWCAQSPSMCPPAWRRWICGWHKTDRHSSSLWPESFPLLLQDFSPPSPHLSLGLHSAWSVKHFSSAATVNLSGPAPLADAQLPSGDLHTPLPTWKHMLLSKGCWFPVARIHVRRFWGAPPQLGGEWVGVWHAVCCWGFRGVCICVSACVHAWGGGGTASERIWNHYHNGQEWVFGVCLCVWMDYFGIATKPDKQHSRKAGWPRGRETD